MDDDDLVALKGATSDDEGDDSEDELHKIIHEEMGAKNDLHDRKENIASSSKQAALRLVFVGRVRLRLNACIELRSILFCFFLLPG
jgi:hypothetical protein